MEVRCGTCNKPFRVSDDKITGTGIKFPCTRCGAYVTITREDLEHYTLSHGAVPGLDLFEELSKPVASPLSPEATEPVAGVTVPPEHESQTFDLSPQATHEDAQEKRVSVFPEPDYIAPEPAPEPEPAVESKPEPLMQSKPKTVPPVESQPEPKPEPLFVPQQKDKPAPDEEIFPEPAGPTPPVSPPPETPIQPAVPKKEYDRSTAPPASPAVERMAKEPLPSSTPSRSGRMILVLIGMLIILGLAGYGIFVYLQPPPHEVKKEAVHETMSIEGLQILSPVGSVEANGDLLINGVIQNTAEKEITAWYVVTEVYNAQGVVLSKIRLLNGKQIFSRRDYDILANRGMNVQELKAKNLQDKGVIIPPKGKVNFEMRYLLPTAGIASFIVQVLPFDPVQLQKEITEEIK
jgi:hypothetical protein